MNTTATLSYLRVAPLSVVLSARFFQMAAMPVAVVSDLNAEIINLKPLEQKELEKRGGRDNRFVLSSHSVDVPAAYPPFRSPPR